MSKELTKSPFTISLEDKSFADKLIMGMSIEKAYKEVYSIRGKDGKNLTVKSIKALANQVWQKPSVQQYIISIEAKQRKTKTEVLTKEYFASDLHLIYEKLLDKAKVILEKETTTINDKDILKFVLDYSGNIVDLLNLGAAKDNSEEDKLTQLINMLDEEAKRWDVDIEDSEVIDVEYRESETVSAEMQEQLREQLRNQQAEQLLKNASMNSF